MIHPSLLSRQRKAEGVGFEPTDGSYPFNGFQDRHLRPLGQPSYWQKSTASACSCRAKVVVYVGVSALWQDAHQVPLRPGETTVRPCRWATAAVLNSYVAKAVTSSLARAMPMLSASKGVSTPWAKAASFSAWSLMRSTSTPSRNSAALRRTFQGRSPSSARNWVMTCADVTKCGFSC